ncbi:MAG: DUF421 domain-containing protein [Syntrophomonadaceae bacterium]|jgi:uncharacterized membrane protein YcaP (DUF421 family)|nr:DUF421 domain-containing protein [Syntrophomonadaceae bacterium]
MNDYIQALLQTLAAFAGLFIYARILGKQQMSQLTFYDYVAGITLGEIGAAIALDEGGRILLYLWILTWFFILTWLTGWITLKSRPLRKIIEGEPVILIHNGKILEHNMKKARYNIDDLMMQLRAKDCFDIKDAEFALAEIDGSLTVLKKSQSRPVTPADLQVDTKYEGIPSEIIIDGEIIYRNLQQNNLDEKWLIEQLKNLGFTDAGNISYAALDADKNLYIDEYRDKLGSGAAEVAD